MVVFGGRSGEHEVSLASARAIMDALREGGRHEVVPVGISREGAWVHTGDPMRELRDRAGEKPARSAGVAASDRLPPGIFGEVDVVFPVLHGPYGEDGTVQGMLELLGVPYVGSGVLASAASMDKVTMKKVFAYHGLPQVRWLGLTRGEWQGDRGRWTREIEASLGYPCFVKPSNLGSSVGINRADSAEELASALDEAAALDRRIIVEEGVDAREIEVAVLGNEEPDASLAGEIVVSGEGFYDYEAKYTEGRMELVAPADVTGDVAEEIGRVARLAYTSIDAAGMARVDFFLERGTGRLLLNEINTIPGFTPTSVYPKLWSASGLPYEGLLDRLIQLALERHGATA
ncbi:D-alanine--D-alanine ligase [Rubrobacter marinus]|uniref:D-alanine--D-alanine ligase n=1 Tax=Rubrobacter marinus TaxID=2653852 RepID=A0A6G8Q2F3_9ACTN|nr:D-alanine--D-alanine ligase family protein [Rubrobacter marinus]QIN80646.1 D-alanine--D-alanine ligase [Rubrobacter marinus]